MTSANYLFPPSAPATLPIQGSSQLIPVHRIYCIGRNYEAHAVEMGHDPNKEPPFSSKKCRQPCCECRLSFPKQSQDVHHEVEMVVVIGKAGEAIAVENALDHVLGYAVGLDMTCRDLQAEAKKLGRPWEPGKSFENAAPCSQVVLASDIGHPSAGDISLSINGEIRQQGDLNQLIWKVPELVSVLSNFYRLQPGDLIFSGTPSGVGPVRVGDRLEARIASVGSLSLSVVA
jgi:2-keto-4-pentenoate hydratase/2-oxohepta-3-ene-1,7-dioic acid hydratase (catechol pathway)